MTLKEAETIEMTLKKIRDLEHLNSKIRKLHNEKKHDEVCEIAFSLQYALLQDEKDKLSSYPNL